MDFKDKIVMLAERISKLKDNVKTEESTKTSFILPFLQTLGYDIFNPEEVTPESDCDYGTKKGEKIDYTVRLNGEPIMLVECKHWSADLDKHKAQLFRYYHVSPAKFGVLTNGIIYKFFTDLEAPNKMDDKPFFTINLLDLRDSHIDKLKEFAHDNYDINIILNSANELKYINAIKTYIATQSVEPSEDFVKFVTKQVYDGAATKKVLDEFAPMVKRAFNLFTNDYVNNRLKSAMTPDVPAVEVQNQSENDDSDNGIITTEEEIQGFFIVRAILCNTVDNLDRVVMRDAQSYCAILFDNNNRKPICRLHFNGKKKYVETFDADKVGTKHLIESMNDIYKLSSQLKGVVETYM